MKPRRSRDLILALVLVGLLFLVGKVGGAYDLPRYHDSVQDMRGNAISGAKVYVYHANTTTLATLYNTSNIGGATKANPLTSDSHGRFWFYAPIGRYDLTVTRSGLTTYTIEDIEMMVGWPESLAVSYTELGLEDANWGYGTFVRTISGSPSDTLNRISPANARAFGAVGDGATDDCDSLQAAIDHVAAGGGGRVYIPGGVYRLKSLSSGTSDAFPSGEGSFLNLKAGVSLFGDGSATILRVAGDAGNYESVIHQDDHTESLDGVRIFNLCIDQNSDSNTVAAAADLTDNPRFAVEVYKSSGLAIENVHFKNCSSTNIVYVNGKADCINTTVQNCLFSDVGGESVDYDHSSIYIHGDGMKIVGNRFYGEKLYGRAYGTRTAIETHGPNQVVVGNSVSKYRTFANITGISTVESRNITVSSNIGDNLITGITLWSRAYTSHYASTDFGLTNAVISSNSFHLCNADSAAGHTRHGVGFAKNNGTHPLDVRNMTIANNTITYEPQPATTTVTLDPYSAAIALIVDSAKADSLTFHNITVIGNTIRYCPTTGIRLAAKMRNVKIVENQIISPARTTYTTAILDAHRAGILAYPSGGRGIDISRNFILADTASTKFGIYLGSTAACTLMNVQGNVCSGVPAGYTPIYLTDLANLRAAQFNISLNVQEWGALGTQSNNDAAVIAAVVEAADDAGGGDVYFPEGHYITGGTVTADSANVRITGFPPPDSLIGGRPRLLSGNGTPEASIWAPIGSIWQNKTGVRGREVFYKSSGTGNTLWLRRDQLGRAYMDTLSEYTSEAGVYVDDALLKDGAFIRKVTTAARAADDSLVATEDVVWFSGQATSIFCTLPTYATVPVGKKYTILNIDASDTVFVEANGAELLNGSDLRRAISLPPNAHATASFLYAGATVGWVKVD